jgi:hypothetical protein
MSWATFLSSGRSIVDRLPVERPRPDLSSASGAMLIVSVT